MNITNNRGQIVFIEPKNISDFSELSNFKLNDEEASLGNPILVKDNDTLEIYKEYYLTNKEELDVIISNNILFSKENSIRLYEPFTESIFLEKVALNHNFSSVTLTNENRDYSLTGESFNILSKNPGILKIYTKGVSEDLKNCYDQRIVAQMNKGIGKSMANEFLVSSYINIDSNNIEEIMPIIEQRDYDLNTLVINVNSYKGLYDILDLCRNKYKDAKLILNINTNNQDFDMLKEIMSIDDIAVSEDCYTIPINKYLEKEEKIKELLEPLNKIKNNLSPLETYIKLYELVKDFKAYKEVPDELEKEESRQLSKILFNDYIVCIGYTNFLADLCNRYDIETYQQSVTVGHRKSEYDEYDFISHARLLVKIKDDKYNVDGLFVSDPTFDNKKRNNFGHLLMTFDQVTRESMVKDSLKFSVYDFLAVKSEEEFYSLIENPTAKEKLEYLSYTISKFDKTNESNLFKVEDSFCFDYKISNPETLKKVAKYCADFKQEEISGQTLMNAIINLRKQENPNYAEEEFKMIFQDVKKKMVSVEESLYPTIKTEKDKEKIFDFNQSQYQKLQYSNADDTKEISSKMK